jgi:biotin-(acetyl-CoA carboxylase) ligase
MTDAAILGIGCNINHNPEDFPAELRGKTIEVQTGHAAIGGRMVGLEDNGHLLPRLPSGKIEVINSGNVLL